MAIANYEPIIVKVKNDATDSYDWRDHNCVYLLKTKVNVALAMLFQPLEI